MEVVIDSSLMEMRASRGIAKEYAGTSETQDSHDADAYQTFIDMAKNDPIIFSAMERTVELATKRGYGFHPKKQTKKSIKQAEEAQNYFDNVLDYDIIQDNVFASQFLFGEVMIEMRVINSKISELWVLEQTEMSLEYDKHGDIKRFVQNPNTANEQEWSPDEIMYIRNIQVGSSVRSMKPLEPISATYSSYIYGTNYLLNIFKNLPPKLLYILKNANQTSRKQFIKNLVLAKQSPAVDLVTNGDADVKNAAYDFTNGLLEVLKYLREQILIKTGVPAVVVGMRGDGGANRGDAEAIMYAYEAKLEKMHRRVESHFNKSLLPKLGYSDVVFKYNPISLKSEKQILENAERLRNMGANNELTADYLNTNGILVKADQFTEEISKDKDLMPSRNREDRQTSDMTSNRDQHGASDQSEKKKTEMRSQMRHWYTR